MGIRGLSVLRLAGLPLGDSERDAQWQRLCKERTEAATVAILRDYARRKLVTSENYRTAQLTKDGLARRNAGEDIQRERAT